MELTDASGRFVRLSPVRYEFSSGQGFEDEFDRNWLMIEGHCDDGVERWKFIDPALIVDEALRIGTWLREAASGRRPNPLEFIEPNLSFRRGARSSELIVIRIHLSAEALPPRLPRTWPMPEAIIELSMSPTDLTRAAEDWDATMVPFPVR